MSGAGTIHFISCAHDQFASNGKISFRQRKIGQGAVWEIFRSATFSCEIKISSNDTHDICNFVNKLEIETTKFEIANYYIFSGVFNLIDRCVHCSATGKRNQ